MALLWALDLEQPRADAQGVIGMFVDKGPAALADGAPDGGLDIFGFARHRGHEGAPAFRLVQLHAFDPQLVADHFDDRAETEQRADRVRLNGAPATSFAAFPATRSSFRSR